MTDQELKLKVRTSMNQYLKIKGWPGRLTVNELLQHHLQEMWKKLDSEGFVEPLKAKGHTYHRFIETAIRKAREAEMFRQIFGNR